MIPAPRLMINNDASTEAPDLRINHDAQHLPTVQVPLGTFSIDFLIRFAHGLARRLDKVKDRLESLVAEVLKLLRLIRLQEHRNALEFCSELPKSTC